MYLVQHNSGGGGDWIMLMTTELEPRVVWIYYQLIVFRGRYIVLRTKRIACLRDEDHDPTRCPSPRSENTMPKDTSWVPTSRESAGTAGPNALTNTPSKKKDKNMASDGTSRFTSRARAILLAWHMPVQV